MKQVLLKLTINNENAMHLDIQTSTKGSTVNIAWNNLDSISLYKLKVYSENGLLSYLQDIINSNRIEIIELSSGSYFCELEAFLHNGEVVKGKSEIFRMPSGMRPIVDKSIDSLIRNPDFYGIDQLVKNSPLSLKHAFIRFRSIFHSGGVVTKKHSLLDIIESMLKNYKWLIPSQNLFLLSILVYGKNEKWLIENYDVTYRYIKDIELPNFEEFFLTGLLNYKTGNFSNAQKKFSRMIPYKDYLQSHQLSSLNYMYKYDNCNSYKNRLNNFIMYKKAGLRDEGVVLISCDWGYYSAYCDLINSKINDCQLNIHYHLVLPEGFRVSDLDINIHERIGISYEIEPLETRELDIHYKTYYSVVRYLVAGQISSLYDQKILISDIDIVFENNIIKVFNGISNDEAAVVFSKSDLPWTKIMAGFNVFGKDFFAKDFYLLLCNFIIDNLDSNLNFWMLDQVALDVAYVNSSRDTISYIKSMNTLIDFKIFQQPENSKYKHLARSNIINKISEIKSTL